MKNKNSAARCIVVLLVIAVVCVATLGILNDVLYVPPDMSAFSKAASGTYEADTLQKVQLSNGKVELVVKGKLDNGKDAVGLFVLGNKSGKADSFKLAIVFEKDSKNIVGVYMDTDGSTGGYSYDKKKLENAIGKPITSDFLTDSSLLVTGATNSSFAVRQALQTANEYYTLVLAK
ncbi:MAG: hypothetical protein RR458_02080 [Clostridia bacterium]